MRILRATLEDATRISYLIRKNTERVLENQYSAEQVQVWKNNNTPEAIRQQLKDRTIFVAIQNNRLLGTIGLKGDEIVGLYVSYSRRKMGTGRALLEHLFAFAESKQINSLKLTSTVSAKRFYERNGFKAIKPVSVKIDGVDFMETLMVKNLK